MSEKRIVLVGYDAEGHVGRHLAEAATAMQLEHRIVSPAAAFDAPRITSKFNWIFRGHLPTRLREFSERVAERCRDVRATHLIATGIAPVDARALRAIRAAGTQTVNWLTDDPWNRAHRAPWFYDALGGYDVVYTPRAAVMDEVIKTGAGNVERLPFAFCPQCHFPMAGAVRDVISFVGGADKHRVAYIEALLDARIPVELYGGYWDRFRSTRGAARGFVDMEGYRRVVATTAASICLVRAANRDQHVMRSYEVPAMRGCMLAQDTPDHRAMFGANGKAVRYFGSPEELVLAAGTALDSHDRSRLADNAFRKIATSANTYGARLEALLGRIEPR